MFDALRNKREFDWFGPALILSVIVRILHGAAGGFRVCFNGVIISILIDLNSLKE